MFILSSISSSLEFSLEFNSNFEDNWRVKSFWVKYLITEQMIY